MSSLPPLSSLLSDGWRQFTRDGRSTRRIAVWFLLVLAVGFVSSILRIPVAIGVAALGQHGGGVGFLMFLSFLIGLATFAANLIILFMTVIRLYQFILHRDHHATETPHTSGWPWNKFWSVLWIVFLIVLISLACLLGGAIIFGILLGILKLAGVSWMISLWISGMIGGLAYFLVNTYFQINFSQSILILLEDGVRGSAALATSKELVKGRWWAAFWRLFVPGLLYLLFLLACYAVLIIIALLIVGATVGGFALSTIAHPLTGLTAGAGIGLIVFGLLWLIILALLPYFIQIFLYPYFLTVHVKLFHSLKSSR